MDEYNRSSKLAMCPVVLRAAIAICWAVGLTLWAAPAAGEEGPADWSGQARWGLEYDDNPHRLEGPDHEGDALTRYLLGGDIVADTGESGQVSASFRHGGTWFWRRSDANAMVTAADVTTTYRPFEPVYVQALADVKDRIEAANTTDYTRGGAAGRLGATFGSIRPWADAGGQFFAFKPSASSSHRGPRIRTGVRWMARSDLAVDASLQRAWRSFSTTAWEIRDDRFVPVGDGVDRRDVYDALHLAAMYRDRVDAHLRYQYTRNDSNSYGQGLRRHRLVAGLTTPGFWETFFSVSAEVQRTSYEDPVAIDELFLIDEEQRNSFAAGLSRTISEPWEVELRYSLFTGEFGVGEAYRRQTLAVSIGIHLDDAD